MPVTVTVVLKICNIKPTKTYNYSNLHGSMASYVFDQTKKLIKSNKVFLIWMIQVSPLFLLLLLLLLFLLELAYFSSFCLSLIIYVKVYRVVFLFIKYSKNKKAKET